MCGNAMGFLLRLRCLRPSVMNRIAVYSKPKGGCGELPTLLFEEGGRDGILA